MSHVLFLVCLLEAALWETCICWPVGNRTRRQRPLKPLVLWARKGADPGRVEGPLKGNLLDLSLAPRRPPLAPFAAPPIPRKRDNRCLKAL